MNEQTEKKPAGYWEVYTDNVLQASFAHYTLPTKEEIKTIKEILNWTWKQNETL